MTSSESLSKIAPALTKAQAAFKAVAKSGQNTYDRYSYACLEDYVRAVKPILSAHGLSVLSSAEEVVNLEDRATKNGGKEHAVRVKLNIRIIHESGEWVEASAWGEGQDRADKAVYKAITGARKYGLASALGLATSDDPEADEHVGRTGGDVKADALADNEQYIAAVDKAFQQRGFQPDEADKAIAAALKAYQAMKLEDMRLEDRHLFIGQINEGRADKYKKRQQAAGAR